MKWAEPSVFYPLRIRKKKSNQMYSDNRSSHSLTTCSHLFPKAKSWLYFFFHFTFRIFILWVLSSQNKSPFHDHMSNPWFLPVLFLLMPFQQIPFPNCSSRILEKGDGVEHNTVISLRGTIIGKGKINCISLLHTTFYLILTNTLDCMYYYIYLPDKETKAQK